MSIDSANPTHNEHFQDGKYLNPKLQAAVDEGYDVIERAKKAAEGIWGTCPRCSRRVVLRWDKVEDTLSALSQEALARLIRAVNKKAGREETEQNTEQPRTKLL